MAWQEWELIQKLSIFIRKKIWDVSQRSALHQLTMRSHPVLLSVFVFYSFILPPALKTRQRRDIQQTSTLNDFYHCLIMKNIDEESVKTLKRTRTASQSADVPRSSVIALFKTEVDIIVFTQNRAAVFSPFWYVCQN